MNRKSLVAVGLLDKESEVAVFEAPWEASLFAIAFQLSEKGFFDWTDWTETLGKEIRDSGDDGSQYYLCWCNALQTILIKSKILSHEEIETRTSEWQDAYLKTPHGKPVEL